MIRLKSQSDCSVIDRYNRIRFQHHYCNTGSFSVFAFPSFLLGSCHLALGLSLLASQAGLLFQQLYLSVCLSVCLSVYLSLPFIHSILTRPLTNQSSPLSLRVDLSFSLDLSFLSRSLFLSFPPLIISRSLHAHSFSHLFITSSTTLLETSLITHSPVYLKSSFFISLSFFYSSRSLTHSLSHTHTYIHTHIYIYIYTHTHTHTLKLYQDLSGKQVIDLS